MSYMNNSCRYTQGGQRSDNQTMSIGGTSSESNTKTMGKRTGKRPGRKPSKIDERAKLERSRQSARECRARKKLRYQYLEELVLNREKAVFALRDELESYKKWCIYLDKGVVPDDLKEKVTSKSSLYSTSQSSTCSMEMHDFSNDAFGRDVPDSHKEDT
uniref:BZIP domain-containing protein n=1 Tax=Arion vulgaris TaxID=1028688 RepID=A0A0B6ZL88_9EUPU